MSRSTVGLLAAVGAALSVLGTLAPTHVILVILAVGAATASGSAASLAIPTNKKKSLWSQGQVSERKEQPSEVRTRPEGKTVA